MRNSKSKSDASAWKAFENLVASLQRSLDPGSVIEQSIRIVGKKSLKPRELDIVLRAIIGGHTVLIVLECRHYRRKLDVGHVEAFANKLEDVGANLGIIVTNSGFSEAAINTANSHGVQLMTVKEVQQKIQEGFFQPARLTAAMLYANIDILGLEPVDDDHFQGVSSLIERFEDRLDEVTLSSELGADEIRMRDVVNELIRGLPRPRSLGRFSFGLEPDTSRTVAMPGGEAIQVRALVVEGSLVCYVKVHQVAFAKAIAMQRVSDGAVLIKRHATDELELHSLFDSSSIMVTQENLTQQPPYVRRAVDATLAGSKSTLPPGVDYSDIRLQFFQDQK